jgi:hypothetical protein
MLIVQALLSALDNTFGGIVNPSCLAVLRLTVNSNLVDCSTGMSERLASLRILSIITKTRLKGSAWSSPQDLLDKILAIVDRWQPIFGSHIDDLFWFVV